MESATPNPPTTIDVTNRPTTQATQPLDPAKVQRIWTWLTLIEAKTTVSVPLMIPTVTIGRAPDGAVCVVCPAAAPHHCELARIDGAIVFRDLSRSGTTVNGRPIVGVRLRVALPPNLVIGTDGLKADITVKPSPDKLADLYEVGESVGQGASAEVFRGQSTDEECRPMAIMCVCLAFIKKANELEMFEREVDLLKMLKHPLIVTAEAMFLNTVSLVLVTEWVGGRTLSDAVHQGLTGERKKAVFRQLLKAVRHVHEHNIVHRDIKPDNVLLTVTGRVKLADFSVSKWLAAGPCTTFAGTEPFVAPEVYRARPYGAPADMWSCGAVLHFMFVN